MNHRNDEYLTPGEAAKRFNVTTTTLLRWFRSERIGGITLPGGHHRYRREDIAKLAVESGEVEKFEGTA